MKRCIRGFALVLSLSLGWIPVSRAQEVVIDPTNLIQNILSVLYELEAVSNQVNQLQNEAEMLEQQGRHLTSLDYNSLSQLRTTLATTTRLLQEAEGIAYSVAGTDAGIGELYPLIYTAADAIDRMADAERRRRAMTRAATQTAMRVQAQSHENMEADTDTLAELVDASQSAVGQLQATQATNQLLALQARLSMQEQQLRIAIDRAGAVEQARLTALAAQTAELQRRFLGTGTRYTPTAVDYYGP